MKSVIAIASFVAGAVVSKLLSNRVRGYEVTELEVTENIVLSGEEQFLLENGLDGEWCEGEWLGNSVTQ